mmetsp:Transcript_27576/g.39474  ORF Transcript_27576/g.39474 Transcript_27576/m.39474 type:complete len:381 (-) Transcript_27576:88-1230(-)
MSDDIVIVDYKDLLVEPNSSSFADKQMQDLIGKAFGSKSSNSYGILAIRGIPGFVEAKECMLPMAHKLAHLPESYLDENLTDEKSFYNAGWSHGKEKLGGKPDTSKGSFYFNPLVDCPGTESDRALYPASYPCNLWPSEDVLPGFRNASKAIGTLMYRTVVLLSKHMDHFVFENNKATYSPNLLHDILNTTEKVKGRLLYYFPLKKRTKNDVIEEDSWIGWHNDSGFLTALAGEIYVNDETGDILPTSLVDPQAGLYVANRKGETRQIVIPHDCMAVQLGECVQILTGGFLIATPHCVRGAPGIARISLPCFIDSIPTFRLTAPSGTKDAVLCSSCNKVPPLSKRWIEDGMTFGDFLHKSFELYYSWSAEQESNSNESSS